MSQKVIIFAHARSGSNSLMRILDKGFGFSKSVVEPFNPKFNKEVISAYKQYVEFYGDQYLRKYWKKIITEYDLVKHLYGQLSFVEDRQILESGNFKIIFLTRKNVLKREISGIIARKTKNWFLMGDENIKKMREKVRNTKFEPVKVEKVREMMKYSIKLKEIYRNFLIETNKNFIEVFYEDLFDEDLTIDAKIAEIRRISNFVRGHPDLKEHEIKTILKILDVNENKINNEETYLSIPNIFEIERELGNFKTGFLFNNSEFNIRKKANINYSREQLQNLKQIWKLG